MIYVFQLLAWMTDTADTSSFYVIQLHFLALYKPLQQTRMLPKIQTQGHVMCCACAWFVVLLCCVDKTSLSHDEDVSSPSPVSILTNRTMDLVHRNSYGDLSMSVALQILFYFMLNVIFTELWIYYSVKNVQYVSTYGHSSYRISSL
jgi:hypothetical protein